MSAPSEWQARLDLAYERRGEHTVPTLRRHLGPLRVQKHFEPLPGVCEHVLVHPPGGIAGGDTLEVAVALGRDAAVRMTTPGATKWYRGAGRTASQRITADLEGDSSFELLPHEHIVFDGADATSALEVRLERGARFIGWDLVALGRQAGGQAFATGCWRSSISLSIDGRPAFEDRLVLAADSPLRESVLGLDGNAAFGTAVFAGFVSEIESSRIDRLRSLDLINISNVEKNARPSLGLTQLPGVLVARAVAPTTEAIFQWFTALWHEVSPWLMGRPAKAPRIWRT